MSVSAVLVSGTREFVSVDGSAVCLIGVVMAEYEKH